MNDDAREYSWSWNDEDFNNGTFSCIEDAIRDAQDSADDGDSWWRDIVYVADAERAKNEQFFPSAGWVIEHMQEMAWGDFGDLADDYCNATIEARTELDQLIDQMLGEWCKKHNIEPSFYRVNNSKIHQLAKQGDNHETK